MHTNTFRTLAGLALTLAIAACGGDEPKDAAAKADALYVAEATKEGASSKARAAQAFTGLASAEAKDPTTIGVGDTRSGALDSSDPMMPGDTYFDVWTLEISSPTTVDIAVSSDQFDTYIALLDGLPAAGGAVIENDDDGGDGTNSRLQISLDAGEYLLVVTSYGSEETGSYSLGVRGPSGSGDAGRSGGYLQPGTVSGELTRSTETLPDGSHFDSWQFNGAGGDQVTVSVRSGEFDTYLILLRGTQLTDDASLAQDDDGGSGTNSELTYTLPESGTYTVLVNSYGPGETGTYELDLESRSVDWADRYPSGGDPNGKYAVVVGIDDYPGTRSDLRGPVDDAALVRDALVGKFGFPAENVLFLRDGQATRLGIANAVLRHLGQAGPNGTAVFFYSGHGTQMGENLGITGVHDPEAGNDTDEALAVYDGVILDEEVNFLLQQIEAENTLVLVDACYSGTVNRAADAMAKFVPGEQIEAAAKPTSFITADLSADFGFGTGTEFRDALANPDRHVFMAASSEDQLSWAIGSWPDRDGPASLWTYYWAEVVNEVPTSATFAEIQEMILERVNRHVREDQGLDTQTPQLLAPRDKANMSIGEFLGG